MELLPGYETDDREIRRYIKRKRFRCRLNGHQFALEAFDGQSKYTLVCQRCFPHIHSRRVVTSYNLFSTPQKEPH